MRSYEKWLVLLCLFLAFALRVYRLDGQEIWGDEAYSITVASWPLLRVISPGAETNPPLYFVILWGAIRLAGRSAFAIRFPSVLAGLLAVPLMYRFGKTVEKRTGLWAAGLTAFSSFLVYYSQEARMYALPLAGATGSLLTFLLLLEREWNRRPASWSLWGLYVLSSLIAIYSHYYALAVLLAQPLFLLVLLVRHRRLSLVFPWLAIWGLIALCFLPWMLAHRQFLQGKASYRFAEWTLSKLGEIGARALLAYSAGKTLPASLQRWGWGIVGIALFGLGKMILGGKGRIASLLALTLLVGLLFAWTVNPIMPFFEERYLLFCAPPFLLLVAAGLSGKGRLGRTWAFCGILYFAGLNGLSLWHYHFNPTFHKGEYGKVMALIKSQASAGDLLLLNNPLQGSLFDYYGPRGIPHRFIPRDVLLTDQEADQFFRDATAGYQRVWLVEFGHPAEYDPSHRARAWLAQHGYLGLRQDYLGITLSMFILDTPAGIEHPVDVVLGDEIRLRGYSLKAAGAHPDNFLLVTLYWEALRPIANSYTVFVHLMDTDGHLRAQIDSPPAGGTLPTNTWVPGEVISDHYALPLPAELVPGQYRLNVGMYLWPEMRRLTVLQNGQMVGDFVPLGLVEIR